MPDTFNSWFLVTELHVWMLMVRAMAEGDEGRFVRNNIVEAMWEDVITRVKKLEVCTENTVNHLDKFICLPHSADLLT
jgi:cytochrome b pre-mRNA-processing protein 3